MTAYEILVAVHACLDLAAVNAGWVSLYCFSTAGFFVFYHFNIPFPNPWTTYSGTTFHSSFESAFTAFWRVGFVVASCLKYSSWIIHCLPWIWCIAFWLLCDCNGCFFYCLILACCFSYKLMLSFFLICFENIFFWEPYGLHSSLNGMTCRPTRCIVHYVYFDTVIVLCHVLRSCLASVIFWTLKKQYA